MKINYKIKRIDRIFHLMSLLMLFVILQSCNNILKAQTIRVGSYNLRYENSSDKGNLWANRCPQVAGLITFHDFDIFGVQEGLQHQLITLQNALSGYRYYGIGRDDGKQAGEHEAIFYKTDKFELLDKGDFWLSSTPDIPSKSWDAPCCNRLCTWVKMSVKSSGKVFYMFNAHYDYEKDFARNESSKLMLQKIKEIAKDFPVIMTGDINGGHSSSWYQILENSPKIQDSYALVKDPYMPRGSFNGFGKVNDMEIIDQIFVSKEFKAEKWGVLGDNYINNGQLRFPSDHCPVMAVLSFQ